MKRRSTIDWSVLSGARVSRRTVMQVSAASGATAYAAEATPSAQRRFWRRLRGERKALLGLVIVAILAVLAIFGPVDRTA